MAAPSYTEDLTDIDVADAVTNWAEPTDAAWDDGGAVTADADYPYLEGARSISQQCTKASISALMVNAGTGLTIPTDGAVLLWQFFASNALLETYANGGLRTMAGNSLAAFYSWDVGGRNKAPNPYGGWISHALDPNIGSPDDTAGAPTGTWQYFGCAVLTTAGISKGNPHAVDVVRYGRCSSIYELGSVGDGACTFAGFAAADETSLKWGLLISKGGGYLFKGKMTLGTASNAVYFVDSNVSIAIDDTPNVTSGFNEIEVNNASSQVDWTNVRIAALGTNSRGIVDINDGADVNWDLCQFDNMGAFDFGGTTTTCTDAAFRGCGQIAPKGADLRGSAFSGYEGAADSGYVNWDVSTDPNSKLDNCEFTKGTASTHAIEFDATNSPTTMTLNNITYSGYNVSDGQTDSALYFKRTTGGVTVNYSGSLPTYKSAGATITFVSSVTVTLTGLIAGTEVRVYKTSDGSVVDGTESSSTSFAFSAASGLGVYIRIFNVDYLPADIVGYTIPASAASLPIQQIADRWYDNP